MVEMKLTRFESLDYQTNEAFNTLCTNMFFAGGDIKKIMVTSCHPQEGKSFVTMNLMRSLAGLGMKVVLVDADIRASAIRGTYGVEVMTDSEQPYPGLTRYLAGGCRMDEIIAQTDIPNAWMILAGRTVTNSLPLLSTPRLEELLDALAKQFDIVLVDAPPVGTIIDAAKIVGACDGALFVIESDATSRQQLMLAMQQMEKTGVPVLGTVLNKFDEKRHGDKYYYYHKSYYSSEDQGNTKKSKFSLFGMRKHKKKVKRAGGKRTEAGKTSRRKH